MEGKDFSIRRWILVVRVFCSSLEVCCIPSDNNARFRAVTFMPRTAMAVVRKSTRSSPAMTHCTTRVTGQGTIWKILHRKGLAKRMVSTARAPHSRE